ncbi:MAG: flagellar biosynthesis regulator FlaF [Pseudomonadota bacterium]
MNALEMARTAYASPAAAQRVRTQQDTEYDAFARVSHKLYAALKAGKSGFPELVAALHDNRKLWTILATNVADGTNDLPESLRAQIFYLAEFTQAHTAQVLRKKGDAGVLVEINSAIMKGLRAQGDRPEGTP